MWSVNLSIQRSCILHREMTQVWLPELYVPNLTGSGGIDGMKQFGELPFNSLTGTSRHSYRHCLVSANVIASQLVINGRDKAVDRKSSRLVSQEVSDLWRITTADPVKILKNVHRNNSLLPSNT